MFSASRLRAPLLSAAASAAVLVLCGGAAHAAAPDSGAAWLWADQPDAKDAYTPNGGYIYNSSGKGVTVTPVSKGLYKITLPGLRANGASNAIATAYGANGYCVVQTWNAAANSATVQVHCYDKAGRTANTRFTLLYQSQAAGFGDSATGLAFVLADQFRSTETYAPDADVQYNSTSGVNTVTREQRGVYMVDMPGLTKIGGAPVVSAYGTVAARCKISDWGQDEGGTHAEVLCFDAKGAAADARFSLLYSRNAPAVHAPGVLGVYAYGAKPTTQDYTPPKTQQYNGVTNKALTVHHAGAGQYSVSIPNASNVGPSTMLVSAVGADNTYCNVVGWYPLLTQCYGQAAATTPESRFTTALVEADPK